MYTFYTDSAGRLRFGDNAVEFQENSDSDDKIKIKIRKTGWCSRFHDKTTLEVIKDPFVLLPLVLTAFTIGIVIGVIYSIK